MRSAMPERCLRAVLTTALIVLGWCGGVHATGLFSGVDVEKPAPVFTRDGDRITARFIPRAKSTSVTVEFAVVSGGTLESVDGVDFVAVDRPEVDIKNFKSAAFAVNIGDVVPGGTAVVAVSSDFFSLSTAFYVFNPNGGGTWIRDAQTENRSLPGRVRELIVPVQDGGERDADGAVNGRIRLEGGPRDSFWGYALGTLFIRFFGIFAVLTMLMAGMLVSGRIFTLLDHRRERKAAPRPEQTPEPTDARSAAAAPAPETAETVAAVIAAALYLEEQAARRPTAVADAGRGSDSAWSRSGRQRIMQERLAVFRQAGANRK